jgi:hypothetical protein
MVRPAILLVVALLTACAQGVLPGGAMPDHDNIAPDDDTSATDDDSPTGDDDATSTDDDSKSGDDDATSTDDDTSTGDDDATSTDDDSSTGDDDATSTDDDSKSGDDDATSTDDDTSTGDDDATSTDDDSSTGDDDSAPSCVPWAVHATAGITGASSGRIDAFDHTVGPYDWLNPQPTFVAVDSGAACAVNLNASTIQGELTFGAGADLGVALCTSWGGQVTGPVTSSGSLPSMPSAAPPSLLPPSTGAYLLDWNAQDSWSSDRTVDSLTLGSNATLTISAPITVHVLGNVAISAAYVRVDAGASLTIYVEGTTTIEWNGSIGSPEDPSRTELVVTGPGGVNIASNGSLHGSVLHPSAQVVLNAGTVFGRTQGLSLTLEWNGAVHGDDATICP